MSETTFDAIHDEITAAGVNGWRVLFKHVLENPTAWDIQRELGEGRAAFLFAGRRMAGVAGLDGALEWLMFETLYLERTGRLPLTD